MEWQAQLFAILTHMVLWSRPSLSSCMWVLGIGCKPSLSGRREALYFQSLELLAGQLPARNPSHL